MSTATKGRKAEWRARDILEAAGYEVTRAAGSKGKADLIAWNAQGVRFISVKCGPYLSSVEREQLMLMEIPPQASVECWRFIRYARSPLIEKLR